MTIVLTILAVGLVCSSVYGQEEVADDDKWQISVTPYFWAPEVAAKSTVSGGTAKLDLSFSDIFSNFDMFGLSGRVEAWKGDWGIFFDGMYVDLEGDFTIAVPTPGPGTPIIGIDVDIEDEMFDFGVAYKLFKVPLDESGNRMLTFAPLGGVLYHYMKREIKLKAVGPGPFGSIGAACLGLSIIPSGLSGTGAGE